jgi:hypothetical protein
MLRVIPIKQEILVTNLNVPSTLVVHPTYMGTGNNAAAVLAVPYPRVR